jgi:hypothetical protein
VVVSDRAIRRSPSADAVPPTWRTRSPRSSRSSAQLFTFHLTVARGLGPDARPHQQGRSRPDPGRYAARRPWDRALQPDPRQPPGQPALALGSVPCSPPTSRPTSPAGRPRSWSRSGRSRAPSRGSAPSSTRRSAATSWSDCSGAPSPRRSPRPG